MRRQRILLALALALIHLSARVSPSAANSVGEAELTGASSGEHHKVLHECRNSDYRTYLKCLQRQRRHHLSGHIQNTEPQMDGIEMNCLETCKQQCQTTKCDKQCSHCFKTRIRQQTIHETEMECMYGECKPKSGSGSPDGSPPNFHTNIGINNIINFTDHTSTHPGGSKPCSTPPCTNYPPSSFVPRMQIVPQLTLGLGLGFGLGVGDCPIPYPWLCPPPGPPVQTPNCAGCGNPTTRQRCDGSCQTSRNQRMTEMVPTMNAEQSSQVTTSMAAGQTTNCVSPLCVGGN